MSSKASKSKEITNESQLIIQHLQKINRPVNATDVANSLQGVVSKTNIQKILTSLTNSGKIIGKAYGKQWIYCASQDDIEIPSLDEAEEEEVLLEELSSSITELKTNNAALQAQLKMLQKTKTTAEINERIEFLTQKNIVDAEKISRLETGDVITVEEKDKIEKAYKEMTKAWSQRKRMFKEIFDTITENYSGKPKALMEQLGIETDEDVNVDIKDF